MANKSSTAVLEDAERRKRRQGSETREMNAYLRVRYHEANLEALHERAGKRLPNLIRQYADLLNDLLPVADEMGVDPFELIRQTATALLDDQQHKQAS
ncbi:hypothetical protein [Mycolicibacterium llatzerense]|uniref:hypothetical protein n=1 Tax=Mycolicibacterium llatzerense TaxID=280871 RepID=UPI0031E0A5C2